MKAIVVYTSKTGFTRDYGMWIAKELSCEAISYKKISTEMLDEYDLIIYGGGVMAGKVAGLDKMKQYVLGKKKKMVVFATGATPMDAKGVIDRIHDGALSKEEQIETQFYYLEAGINYEDMSFFPRTMLKLMYKMLKKKKDASEEDKGMVISLEKSYNNSDPSWIMPLVTYVKGL